MDVQIEITDITVNSEIQETVISCEVIFTNSGGGVEEAPIDDVQYGRQNAEWTPIGAASVTKENVGAAVDSFDTATPTDADYIILGGKKKTLISALKTLFKTAFDLVYEPIITKLTAFNKNFGTTAGTVLEGRTFGSAADSETTDFATALTDDQNYISDDGLAKIETLTTIGGQLTGFVDPFNCDVAYNGTPRTITLTGAVDARWQGVPMTDIIPSFVSGWVSEPHDIADGGYFLYFNGTSFVWSTVVWDFKRLQIAMVYRDGVNFCLRECHGLQDWQSHEANHNNIGTVLRSGGDLSGITINSTTEAQRRPIISQALVYDEDLPSNILALNNGFYTRLFLDGVNNANLETDKTDILEYTAGNRFLYNLFTGGVWTKATAAVNNYAKIFLMAVPTTSDADCQKSRFIWVMPQTVNATLTTIQALTPSNVNLGLITVALAEYVFIQEVIVRATATSWQIISTAKLVGNKRSQAVLTGNFLSSVATDTTLTGDGTVGNPAGVNYAITELPAQAIAATYPLELNKQVSITGTLPNGVNSTLTLPTPTSAKENESVLHFASNATAAPTLVYSGFTPVWGGGKALAMIASKRYTIVFEQIYNGTAWVVLSNWREY